MCSITKDHLAHIPSKATKSKKINPQENSLYLVILNLFVLILERFLNFLKKNIFFYRLFLKNLL